MPAPADGCSSHQVPPCISSEPLSTMHVQLTMSTCVQVPSLHKVVAIKGGEAHTLALTKDGKVLSFGAATYGMLGR